mmetsp:Transcript_8369/g.19620  ORF Transcript_8369/g.19620 Transcript_8369/m.19620 type:complete len:222 (+) Transcript_8369:727-1392(+)
MSTTSLSSLTGVGWSRILSSVRSSPRTSPRRVRAGARRCLAWTTKHRSSSPRRCRSGRRRRSLTISSMPATASGVASGVIVARRPSSAPTRGSGRLSSRTSTRVKASTASSGSECWGTRTTEAPGLWLDGTRRLATLGVAPAAPAAGWCLRSTTGQLCATRAFTWSTTSLTPATSRRMKSASLTPTARPPTARVQGLSVQALAKHTSTSSSRSRRTGWMAS